MAIGGGIWTEQNKTLPGAYINFVAAGTVSEDTTKRGIATIPVMLDWGPAGEVYTVTAEEFENNCLRIFGYGKDAEELRNVKEIFLHASKAHFYNINENGVKASNSWCQAKYPGTRGNSLKIVITSAETTGTYVVSTYLDAACVDAQEVSNYYALADNDFVHFFTSEEKSDITLALAAGTSLEGGTNGSATNAAWQSYFDAMESYTYNVMGIPTSDATIKALATAYIRRMRDELGKKFQVVMHQHAADYEGIISVENTVKDTGADAYSLVYWATGVEAGCQPDASLSNSLYDGAYTVNTSYTQVQLETALNAGKLIMHNVDGETRILKDVNTLTTYTDTRTKVFASNQIVRIIDTIANDIASIFNKSYLGKIPNNESGRVSLWTEIVQYHKDLMADGIIEEFDSSDITVSPGSTRYAVVITDKIKPASVMEQLYVTVMVE